MGTTYDEVAYPSLAFRQTHPDRLAAHGMLFGLPFAPLERFRLLDIGGGDGGNVIPMAVTFPGAQFVSFDLSASAIERGTKVKDTLKLANLDLLQADISAIEFEPASFDYIIVHGVYSWVGERTRDALMALVGRLLSPNGVAFVSYNALPGARIRQSVRDMLLFHLRRTDGLSARA